jgi:uncharacterized membrane protein
MTQRALRRDAGVVAPATALILAAAIGMVGLVGDVGVWFVKRRALQTVTDAAAMAASPYASDATTARAKAAAILTANGYDPTATIAGLQTGWYCQDTTIAAANRFQAARCTSDPSTTPANAVRLKTKADAPLILSKVVAGPGVNSRAIGVLATAARINQAGMEAGVGTLQLSQGMANAALTALTGGSGVNLTLLQYQGLASAHVDALDMLDALALKANVTAGTYDQLLNSNVSVGAVLDAAAQVLAEHGQVAGAAAAIQGVQVIKSQLVGAPTIKLGKLIDLGIWDTLKVGQGDDSPSALRAGLNVYQLATFALQLANGAHAVAIPNSTVGVSGLVTLNVQATVIEPPQKAYFAYGPEGLSVHSASVRLKLSLALLNSQLTRILGVGVQVPLYVEVAGGDATMSQICPRNTTTGLLDQIVKVSARGSVADVWIGQPSDALMKNFSAPVTAADVQPLSVVSLDVLRLGILTSNVTARGHVRVGSPTATATQLTFQAPGTVTAGATPTTTGAIGRSPADPRGAIAPVAARATSQAMLTGLTSGLVNDLTIDTCTIGILSICLLPTTLTGTNIGPLFTILSPVLTALDAPLDALLKGLGVNIGYIDVFVTGVRCGVPVLVE